MMVWKKKKKNFFFFFVFSHPGGSVPLPGVRELGCISGRLPDDPGGFTCMHEAPQIMFKFYRKFCKILGEEKLQITVYGYYV